MALKPLLVSVLLFSACESGGIRKHIIAKVPEASGICYNTLSHTLFVANDEGSIYELSTEGKILRKKDLGDYDLEGVTCDPSHDRLLLAIEGKDNILIVNTKTLNPLREIDIKRTYQRRLILKKDKKRGLEGITITPDGTIYLSNQSKKLLPHEDPSIIFSITHVRSDKTRIVHLFDPRIKDISGLQWHEGMLWFVSDTTDRLYRYDPKKRRIVQKIKLPKFAQEGITFGPDGSLYFADDNGHVLRFTRKELDKGHI